MAQRSSLIISNKYLWEREFEFEVEFEVATSHGKGAVDGIGGTVKREVRNGHVNINTPEQYYSVAQQRNPNIHVHYIGKAELEA